MFYRLGLDYRMVKTVKHRLIYAFLAGLGLNVLLNSAVFANPLQINDLQPQALDFAGVYDLQRQYPQLQGQGVNIAVIARSMTYVDGLPQNDYQPYAAHDCFSETAFEFYDGGKDLPDLSSHATAVCSILFGEDPNARHSDLGQFYYRGVAPQARASVYEFFHFMTETASSQDKPQIDVATISLGQDFEDCWIRGIESLIEQQGVLVVASIGNGSDEHHAPLYPGASANVIGVGVVDSVKSEDPVTCIAHFALACPEHSSCGPTGDGRAKPDIVAPGNFLVAGLNDPNAYEMTGNWSSFATPVVAGTAGLLLQKARSDPNLVLAADQEGGNCVLKAVLMNSATKLPYWHKGELSKDDDYERPLDSMQGAGLINAPAAYDQLVSGHQVPGVVETQGWDLNTLASVEAEERLYSIEINDPNHQFITATVVWNRHYSPVFPFEYSCERDCDIRLEIWAVDPQDSERILLDFSDSKIDNVEHIYYRAVPDYQDYEIVVRIMASEEDPLRPVSERYALAWRVTAAEQLDSILWHDLNADGIVNEQDYLSLINNWQASIESPDAYAIGDVNTDGEIDGKDLDILRSHEDRRAEWYTKDHARNNFPF
jgi:hypothetical protein